MKKYIVPILIIAIILYMVSTRSTGSGSSVEYFEKETKNPGFGGDTTVTPDQMEQMIKLTQPEVSKQLGKCTYCIGTDTVQLVGNVYHVRFMFMVLTGFPYGVGVDAIIGADKDKDPEKLISIEFQSVESGADSDANKFDQFQQISTDTLPTIAQLQAVLKKQ